MKSIQDWLGEISLAQKREEKWRKECKTLWEKYESDDREQQRYNILWSNTEVLKASLYNSPPEPDVRRRFKDADPVGRQVSDVLSRSLSYGIDDPNFQPSARSTVLDMSLTGRGQARVRYVPTIAEDDSSITFEQADLEHVQWDEFFHGPGKTWQEVRWVGFEHRKTKEDLARMFPGVNADGKPLAEIIQYDECDKEQGPNDPELKDSYKTAKIYEIWDKDSKTVLFLSESLRNDALSIVPDPLGLTQFYPCPEPVRIIANSRSLLPIPHYRTYQTQAEELECISARINGLVDAMRVRGLHDPRLTELGELFGTRDNGFVPLENAGIISELGGIDKALWMMPVDMLVKVLQGLYEAFEAQRQHIFEIAGLSDIMRGQSNPNETLGAQELKSQWGSIRINDAQREVQRFIRDILRLQAEIIGNRFQPETIEAMIGYQVSPEVMAVLRSPQTRQYRVDIETDSTVAETINTDMQEMANVLNGLMQWYEKAPIAVQTGQISQDGVKQVALAIARRAKMGSVVEDAIDGQGAQIGTDGQPIQQQQPGLGQEEEKFVMKQVEQAIITMQQALQRLEQDRVQLQAERQQAAMMDKQLQAEVQQAAQQVLGQVSEIVKGVMTDLQQQVAAMQAQVAESVRQSAEVHSRTVEGTASAIGAVAATKDSQREELLTLVSGLADAVNRMAAPRQMSIIRDESGRPVGGISETVQ